MSKLDLREAIQSPKVVYQGIAGAYTEEATALFFGEDVKREGKKTWEDVFVALEKGEADYGVLPIENNSTGSIVQVYDLLLKYGHFIVGEQVVKVDHCLMAKKGTKLEGIKEIFSHEQGILQCADFLKDYPDVKKTACLNTAIACEDVSKQESLEIAAIGSRRAGNLYGLEILKSDINMSKSNYTRFVIISPKMEVRKNASKISTVFTLPDKTGALYEIMGLCAENGMNLTKIESRPIMGREWEYRFFMDFRNSSQEENLDATIEKLVANAIEFKLLGRYKAYKIGE